jgi:HSP20 family protein
MNKDILDLISRRIKDLREEKKLTQEDLAEQLGISRQSIISVEKGRCTPSLPLALRIMEFFEQSFDDFLEPIFGKSFNTRQLDGQINRREVSIMPRGLTPWLPLRDIDSFFEDEDWPAFSRMRGLQFPMINVKQSDKDITITADIPGIKEDDLDIEIGDNFVDISGERKEETKKEDEGYFHQEVRYGSFSRRIPLPTEVVSEKAEATVKDGQLIIIAPKLEPEKPKVTKVKVKKILSEK